MELAIASGVAALGYGITKMFPKTDASGEGKSAVYEKPDWAAFERPEEGRDLDRDETASDDDFDDEDPSLDGYTSFQNRLPPIDPKYKPGKVQAYNDDTDGLPDGTLGVSRMNLPFYRESNRAQSTEVMDRKRDLFTGGTRDAWKPKSEVSSLFEPQMGISHVYGAPVQTEASMQSIQERPTTLYRNGERLVEPQNIGPGLGIGPDVPASYGFHDPTRVLPFNPGVDRIELPGRSNLGKHYTAGDRPLLGQTTKTKRELSTQAGRVGGASFPTPVANAKTPTRVGYDKVNVRTGEIPMNRVGGAGQEGNRQGYVDPGDYTKETTTVRAGEIPLARVGIAGHGASMRGGYEQDQTYTKETTTMRTGGIPEGRVGGAAQHGTPGHAKERGQETMETHRLRTAEIPLERVGIASKADGGQGAFVKEKDYTRQPGRGRNVEVPRTDVGGASRDGVGEYTNRTVMVPHTQRGTEHRGVNPAKGSHLHNPEQVGAPRLRDHKSIEYTPGPQLPVAIPTKGSGGQVHVKQGYEQREHQFSNASDQLRDNPFAVRPLHQVKSGC